jgi:hypothetical protein
VWSIGGRPKLRGPISRPRVGVVADLTLASASRSVVASRVRSR